MKSVGSWNLEGLSTLGRLGLEGLFDILVLLLYSLKDHFGLEVQGEVFSSSSLVFLFNNTSQCSLCLHLSSFTLCTLHLLLIVYAYALESCSS